MSDGQLELFDLTSNDIPRSRRETLGRLLLNLRYDQLALACIGIVLAFTVVFASGVERGKHLARAERLWQEEPARTARAKAVRMPVIEPPVAAPAAVKVDAVNKSVKKSKPAEPNAKPATAARSRYAVQVRTYSKPQSARLELDRLQSKGESAFLVLRDGRVVVYVGPFPSKSVATQKVTVLRTRYQDCFVKTL